MANKQMNQLSTISEVAASDLILVYDISEAGSEKSKSILYSDLLKFGANTISGTGDIYCDDLYTSGSTIHLGTTDLTAPSNDFKVSTNGTQVLNMSDTSQTFGDSSSGEYIQINNSTDKLTLIGDKFGQLRLEFDSDNREIILGDESLDQTYLKYGHTTGSSWMGLFVSGNRIKAGNDIGGIELVSGSKRFETITGGWRATGDLDITGNLSISGSLPSADKIEEGNSSIEVIDTGTGSIELKADGFDIMQWSSQGTYVGGTDGLFAKMVHDAGSLFITNQYVNDNGQIILQGTVPGPSTNTMGRFYAGGAAELYYAGSKRLSTTEVGVNIANDTSQLEFIGDGDDIIIINRTDSAELNFVGYDSGTNERQLIQASADNFVGLFYAGTKVFETTAAGISFTDGTAVAATIEFPYGDGTIYMRNNDPGGLFYILAEKSGGGQALLFGGNPDGSADLAYAGSARLKTHVDGISITDGDVTAATIGFAQGNDDLYIANNDRAGFVFLAAEMASGQKILFSGNPDGAAELYHTGTKVFETTASGIQVDGIFSMLERSVDPIQPSEGETIIWMSDGTGKGDDGDVLIASTAGGVTNYTTLFDHSTGSAW